MKLTVVSLCTLCIFADICFGAPSTMKDQSEKPNYRLNTDIEPIDYSIELTPYLDEKTDGKKLFTFDGSVQIALKTMKSDVDVIVLHYQDMIIKKESLIKKPEALFMFFKDETMDIKKTKYDEITNKYTITLTKPLVVNTTYSLIFEYQGKLQTVMNGFYRSSYEDDNGNIKYVIM